MDFLELFVVFGAFLGGILANWAFIKLAERKALQLRRQSANANGREAQQEQGVRLMAFLTELKVAYDETAAQGAVDLKSFGTTKALPIILKYPDVVAKHGKQLLKLVGGKGGFNLDGLEGLL